MVAVRELHHPDREPTNDLVAIATDGSMEICELWSGSDFVASPRLSPDGTRLVWVAWDHPNMPWDATRLLVAPFADGALGDIELEFGNGAEAWVEPGWGPDGTLYACSDRHEWWNLGSVSADTGFAPVIAGPFEIPTPSWVFGMQRWAITPEHTVAAVGLPTGDELVIDGRTVSMPDATVSSMQPAADGVVYVGAGYGHEAQVVKVVLDGPKVTREVVHAGRELPVDIGYLIEPESITFPTGDGDAVAHALYYPPTNPDHVGVEGTAAAAGSRPRRPDRPGPPPTPARHSLLDQQGNRCRRRRLRGSTGYGRSYRQALNGSWGVADVEDCVAAARYLAERGDVDPERLMIRGGSAGGFTVLSALAFHDVFAVGASRYGVADLEALATDTHKFESRYLDTLWPLAEAKAIYDERSPVNHVEKFSAPMIVLQGDEDAIVPPNQSEMIVAALEQQGIPVSYLLFEGEQHGFRKAENVITALEAELVFFGDMLGFTPPATFRPSTSVGDLPNPG